MGIKRTLLPLIAAAVVVGGGVVASPPAAAEEAILIPGASPFKAINPIYPLIAGSYRYIGVNFHGDDDPQVIRYSQNPLATERALLEGVAQGALAVRAIDGPVVVIGESMGAMVASRLATELAAGPNPPSDVRFVLIASPEEGAARYFPVGAYIPLLNYRVSRVPESPYPTTVVIGEYDGWSDPPDRPWNLVALANAALGIGYAHGPAIWSADPAAVPPGNITVEGTVTRYLVPAENLPLTQPLRAIGIPDSVMDKADEVLRPIIDAAYVRHDQPGDTRPYLSEGVIRRNTVAGQQNGEPGPQQQARTQRVKATPHSGRRDGARAGVRAG